jgi:2-(1,2-epoxy-1,2-dihydrophenyl)acetyl-CoA isomerase
MSESNTVLSELKDHVLTLTLNRPERLNALGGGLRNELYALMQDAEHNSEVRVVVITGAGRAFCSGGDVKEMSERMAGGGSNGGSGSADTQIPPIRDHIIATMRRMPKPVIASVNGVAAGAGMNLALACDMRVASQKAMFTQAFVKRGLHPDWGGTYFLPRLVGTAKACELIFSGDMINAEQALQLGLINRLVPHEELTQATEDFARGFAAGPPLAIGMAKRGIYRNMESDLASSLEYETYAQSKCWSTEDASEGVRAFVEKRPAVFQGK